MGALIQLLLLAENLQKDHRIDSHLIILKRDFYLILPTARSLEREPNTPPPPPAPFRSVLGLAIIELH